MYLDGIGSSIMSHRLLDEVGFVRVGEAEVIGSGGTGWTAEGLGRLKERGRALQPRPQDGA